MAGAVYTLALLKRHGFVSLSLGRALKQRVEAALYWLESKEAVSDSDLPGLFFGDAGVAVTFAEAIVSGLLEQDEHVESFIRAALSVKSDWPDLTHGAAGQGVAALLVADRLGDSTVSGFSHKYAAYLIDSQKEDGSWEMPPGAEGVSGRIYSGFAHGVSGIAYFLAEYARRFPQASAERAWKGAVGWLLATSHTSGDGLLWDVSNSDSRQWKFWCHGTVGIALLFLRLVEQTGDLTYRQAAQQCLRSSPKNIPILNLSLCHGVAGVGEVYLEAARVLGDNEWYERAIQIQRQLLSVASRQADAAIWLVEDSLTADLMIGSSGIVHFLLKSKINDRLGFPLLLDPLPRAA